MEVNQEGFSLVEMVISVAILAVLTVVSVNLFLNTIVGSTKDNSLRLVKQAGDQVLSQMENDWRSVAEVNSCASDDLELTLVDETTQRWSYGEDRIYLGVDELLPAKIQVVPGTFSISCSSDMADNKMVISASFSLESGFSNESKREDRVTRDFATSVVLRNKL